MFRESAVCLGQGFTQTDDQHISAFESRGFDTGQLVFNFPRFQRRQRTATPPPQLRAVEQRSRRQAGLESARKNEATGHASGNVQCLFQRAPTTRRSQRKLMASLADVALWHVEGKIA